jgi:hypothetical protein
VAIDDDRATVPGELFGGFAVELAEGDIQRARDVQVPIGSPRKHVNHMSARVSQAPDLVTIYPTRHATSACINGSREDEPW